MTRGRFHDNGHGMKTDPLKEEFGGSRCNSFVKSAKGFVEQVPQDRFLGGLSLAAASALYPEIDHNLVFDQVFVESFSFVHILG